MANRFEEIACDEEGIIHPEYAREFELRRLLAEQLHGQELDNPDYLSLVEELKTAVSALIREPLGDMTYDYACMLMFPILDSYQAQQIITEYHVLRSSSEKNQIVIHFMGYDRITHVMEFSFQ